MTRSDLLKQRDPFSILVRDQLREMAATGEPVKPGRVQSAAGVDEHVLRVLAHPGAEPAIAGYHPRVCLRRHLSLGGRQIQVQILPSQQGEYG